MEELSRAGQPDWEGVKHLIEKWLGQHGHTIRGLARRAGLSTSVISRLQNGITKTPESDTAIKLFAALEEDVGDLGVDRRRFLKMLGLAPVVSKLSGLSGLSYSTSVPQAHERRHDALYVDPLGPFEPKPHELGTYYMNEGNRIAPYSWEEAILWYRDAEAAFRRSSRSQAANAGSMVAQMFTNLCDYSKAEEEVARVENEYDAKKAEGHGIDPETRYELFRIRGWLAEYLGSPSESERWFVKSIAEADQAGIPGHDESSQHWLGRVYFDEATSGELGHKQRAELRAKAIAQFDKALIIHNKYGTDSQAAYDLLRKAQVQQAQGQWEDARKLRALARGRFSEDKNFVHVDLEDARVLLEQGLDVRVPQRIAHAVLEHWSDLKYAKGMADALRVLGDAQIVELKMSEALELYVAALCLYPYENHLSNRYVWDVIRHIRSDLKNEEGTDNYQIVVRNLWEKIEERQGYFFYLNRVGPDRTQAITRILSRIDPERL